MKEDGMLKNLYDEAARSMNPESDHRTDCLNALRIILKEQFTDENIFILKNESVISTNPSDEIAKNWIKFQETFDEKTIRLIGLSYLSIAEKETKNSSRKYQVEFNFSTSSWSEACELIKELNENLNNNSKIASNFAKRFVEEILYGEKTEKKSYFTEDGKAVICEVKTVLPRISHKTIEKYLNDVFLDQEGFDSVIAGDDKVIIKFVL